MKAAVLDGYNKNGSELAVRDMPMPEPAAGEVLVKVSAAGVNPLDNMIVRGEVKLIVPYRFPLVMGNELVGTVEKLGAGVSRFAVGDRVYGRMPLSKIGAFAEYAAVSTTALAKVPDCLSDEEAACVPLTALTALQSLELMGAKAGESIFISGGTGSLGAMAVPIAAGLGLKVATNGNGASEQRMLSLGASTFIDYRKQDYADVLHDVDYVLDTLGDRELEKEFSVLKPGGMLVSLRGLPNGEFAKRAGLAAWKRLGFRMVGGKYDKMAAKRGQSYRFVFVHEDGAGLESLPGILGERRIVASVDGVFELDQVNAAMGKVAAGGSKGKTILKIR
ncbi:Alcohol dehydrogenase [Slackia heliotrinireducens]|uniref:Zn-dependent oxidoreductase, NADPH:quinone reductase n=1 Tax=Slackia heliotrinireducens (strain ATCC 29202 / DSM 20476 / NCTC 11029 / RHS 1) TaxID=471855 RepID=C7N7H3_SLAHD|nr:NADP-dependent oxidoreductase [Slackia heliotrinireducens]ACV22858.1 Zn-dependent oxidoreductase, NADPH:quinone reductase [Slackia heliotrinireducens DSM 20476]VEH01616.1 Alcohol dehydrogenase [Slackia heliotrinireducens]